MFFDTKTGGFVTADNHNVGLGKQTVVGRLVSILNAVVHRSLLVNRSIILTTNILECRLSGRRRVVQEGLYHQITTKASSVGRRRGT